MAADQSRQVRSAQFVEPGSASVEDERRAVAHGVLGASQSLVAEGVVAELSVEEAEGAGRGGGMIGQGERRGGVLVTVGEGLADGAGAVAELCTRRAGAQPYEGRPGGVVLESPSRR